MKLMAFYFPQFYEIEENNHWWGKGFTDWDLVEKAQPLSATHRQPRKPACGFYDQSRPEVIAQQAVLAEQFGLHGFNFYHYWFDGKLILEKPLELFHANKNHNLKYCVTWANEAWTRQWVGSSEILMAQNYIKDPSLWAKHFNYLSKYFQDDRYLCIDDKPVFCIYRPEQHPDLVDFLKFMNRKAIDAGLRGIYFVAIKSFPLLDENKLYKHFDAIIKFQPRVFFSAKKAESSSFWKSIEPLLRRLPASIQLQLSRIKYGMQTSTSFCYDELWEYILSESKKDSCNVFQSIVVDWDNTARYGSRSHYFKGSTPEKFREGLISLADIEHAKGTPYIFINAWNEWSEAAYLEPDEQYGTAYLDAVKLVSGRTV